MKRIVYTLCFYLLLLLGNAQGVSQGLVAYYPFSGNTNDNSGNYLDAAVHGNPTLVNDMFNKPNGAYYFNGSTDYINFPAPTLATNSFTYAVWVKPSLNDGLGYVVSIGSDSAYQALLISPFDEGGWTVGEYLANGDNAYQSAGFAVDTSHWYHVVYTRNNSKLQLYVDGEKYEAVDVSSAPLYGNNPTANIAKRAGSASQYFKGTIDEVRIYNRVLSDQEVKSLYNRINVQGIQSSLPDNVLSILPNPNSGSFSIDIVTNLTNCEIHIQNSFGEIVYAERMENGFGKKEIEMPHIAQGIYFLTIKSTEGIGTKKLIVH